MVYLRIVYLHIFYFLLDVEKKPDIIDNISTTVQRC